MGERFVGLVRVSTVKQGESGLGLEGGHDDLAMYVKAVGGTLLTTLEEVESGTHDEIIDRPTLLKCLALCKRHKAVLLVPKVDRLVRSTCVHTDIKRSGVSFRAVDNPAANEFTLDILVAVAAQEGRAASDRTRKALKAYKDGGHVSKRLKARLEGQYGGNIPKEAIDAVAGKLGAHLVGSHLTAAHRTKGRDKGNARSRRDAVEVYADLIAEMVAWRQTGDSLQVIADKLNSRGETTRNGAAWSRVQVMRTLDRVALVA